MRGAFPHAIYAWAGKRHSGAVNRNPPTLAPKSALAAAIVLSALLAACQPPATDDYSERDNSAQHRLAPSPPIASPDVTDAIWVASDHGARLLYGIPGEKPMLVLSCEGSREKPELRIIREAPSDRGAKALFALIGNGHEERVDMDAAWTGKRWLWEGRFDANDPRLDVFDGPREVEATLPGGGTLLLKPSTLPGEFLQKCRDPSAAAQPVR